MQVKVMSKSDKEVVIQLSGFINEDSDFSLIEYPDAKRLVLDLAGIRSLSSRGIRSWISWSESVPFHQTVVFQNCPHLVVMQMGTMSGFLPQNSDMHSFILPFFCADCDEEISYVAKKGEDYDHHDFGPEVDHSELELMSKKVECPSCKKEAEIDLNPKRFFKFFEHL